MPMDYDPRSGETEHAVALFYVHEALSRGCFDTDQNLEMYVGKVFVFLYDVLPRFGPQDGLTWTCKSSYKYQDGASYRKFEFSDSGTKYLKTAFTIKYMEKTYRVIWYTAQTLPFLGPGGRKIT